MVVCWIGRANDVHSFYAGCPWIGPNWQNGNWYDAASKQTINVEARCPLIDDVQVNGTDWPEAAQAVMQRAGPRSSRDAESSRTTKH